MEYRAIVRVISIVTGKYCKRGTCRGLTPASTTGGTSEMLIRKKNPDPGAIPKTRGRCGYQQPCNSQRFGGIVFVIMTIDV